MRKPVPLLALLAASVLALSGCGGDTDAKGPDAAAKATGKLVTEWDCTSLFKDVDLRAVLASVSSLDGSSHGCRWEGTVGTSSHSEELTDDLFIHLEDGVPASYSDYVSANGYDRMRRARRRRHRPRATCHPTKWIAEQSSSRS